MEDRITELETKIAFQESAIQSMSDEMAAQQQQIALLIEEVSRMKKELQTTASSPIINEADEPPPHY